jgi:hypothetical protein
MVTRIKFENYLGAGRDDEGFRVEVQFTIFANCDGLESG